jgi:hypothetical protein
MTLLNVDIIAHNWHQLAEWLKSDGWILTSKHVAGRIVIKATKPCPA